MCLVVSPASQDTLATDLGGLLMYRKDILNSISTSCLEMWQNKHVLSVCNKCDILRTPDRLRPALGKRGCRNLVSLIGVSQ